MAGGTSPLREEGIICPVADGSEVNEIGIFNAPIDRIRGSRTKTRGVQAGTFVYDVHPCAGDSRVIACRDDWWWGQIYAIDITTFFVSQPTSSYIPFQAIPDISGRIRGVSS